MAHWQQGPPRQQDRRPGAHPAGVWNQPPPQQQHPQQRWPHAAPGLPAGPGLHGPQINLQQHPGGYAMPTQPPWHQQSQPWHPWQHQQPHHHPHNHQHHHFIPPNPAAALPATHLALQHGAMMPAVGPGLVGMPAVATASPEAGWYATLQRQVLDFAAGVVPTAEEAAARKESFAELSRGIQEQLGHRGAGVILFGSGASGLAVHCSDIDVVVAGLVNPDPVRGLNLDDKQYAVTCLKYLQAWATGPRCRLDVESHRLVAAARVPVLKLKLRRGPEVDVSIGDSSGRAAAEFVAAMCAAHPLLRPLVLVVKSMLRMVGLHEVFTGGLGSWSLTNMALAHLLEEARSPPPPGSLHPPVATHAGAALLSFLRRFSGRGVFDYRRDAVSVRLGGCVPQTLLPPGFARFDTFLVLEDPLTGREVAGGSHRMPDVAAIFGAAADRLERDLARCAGRAEERAARSVRRTAKRAAVAEGRTGVETPGALSQPPPPPPQQQQQQEKDNAPDAAEEEEQQQKKKAETTEQQAKQLAQHKVEEESREAGETGEDGGNATGNASPAGEVAAGRAGPREPQHPAEEGVGAGEPTPPSPPAAVDTTPDKAAGDSTADILAAGPSSRSVAGNSGSTGQERPKRRRRSSSSASEASSSSGHGHRRGGGDSDQSGDSSGGEDDEDGGPWSPLNLVFNVEAALQRLW